jgi:hypothetical protein
VRIKENFIGVKAETPFRFESPPGSIAIELAMLKTGHEDVPVMVSPVRSWVQGDNPGRLRVSKVIKEQ